MFISLCKILAGEEILFDYGHLYKGVNKCNSTCQKCKFLYRHWINIERKIKFCWLSALAEMCDGKSIKARWPCLHYFSTPGLVANGCVVVFIDFTPPFNVGVLAELAFSLSCHSDAMTINTGMLLPVIYDNLCILSGRKICQTRGPGLTTLQASWETFLVQYHTTSAFQDIWQVIH